MIVGLDKTMKGKPTLYQGQPVNFTGYFQHSNDSVWYWQIQAAGNALAWVKNNLVSTNPSYVKELSI